MLLLKSAWITTNNRAERELGLYKSPVVAHVLDVYSDNNDILFTNIETVKDK